MSTDTIDAGRKSYRDDFEKYAIANNLNRPLSIGGFVFITLSFIGFIALGYMCVFVGPQTMPEKFSEQQPVLAYTVSYLAHIIILIGTVVSAMLGVRLLRSAGSAYIRVIPPDDYPVLVDAIREGKSEAIDQYVRLSSLSGFTGGFTKMGLTGLPLTTVGLTLIFAALALIDKGTFLDLAKLTLGAFIGSFVQKQQIDRTASSAAAAPAAAPGSAPPIPRPALPA
jgi:hypothetical protein